jgi:hypothetical protein
VGGEFEFMVGEGGLRLDWIGELQPSRSRRASDKLSLRSQNEEGETDRKEGGNSLG